MAKVLFLSDDPIAHRVMPKLLSVGNIDVIAVRPSGERTEDISALCSGPHAIILDCRVHPEAVLFGFLRFCENNFTRAPIVLFHHHDEHAMDVLSSALNVVASLDAGQGSLQDVVRKLITVLAPQSAYASRSPDAKRAAPPDPGAASGGAAKSATRKKSKHAAPSKKGKPPVEEPRTTPERASASDTPAKKPAAEKPARTLKLNALYNDNGLLDREAREAEHLAEGWPFKRDKPPPFERRLSRKETAAKVAQFAEAKPLKATTQMALRIARDSTASVEDLAQIVKLDQALAARILQLANSSLNRRGKATRTIEQAIVRLGMSTIRESISSMAVLDQFNESEVLNVAMLWEHGYAVGLLAADIARSAGSVSPDDAFVIGLMHDMGRAVMACELGQDYVDALITARMHDVLPAQVEKQFFELNHADAAETIFAAWEFDTSVSSPISNHHLSSKNLKHMDPSNYRQARILQAANTLAHATLLGDSGSDWVDSALLNVEETPVAIGLVRTCVERADETLESLRLVMASTDKSAPVQSYAETIREQVPDGVTLASLGNADVLDPMGLLAWRLAEQNLSSGGVDILGPIGPSERPDLILGSIRNREHLTDLREAIERYDAGGQVVPVLLSVADAKTAASVRSIIGERPRHFLPGTYRVSWVLRGVNMMLDHPMREAA